MNKELTDYSYYLIVDVEATCADDKSIGKYEMEIIEIGAVMVAADSLELVDEFNSFIKPVRNPVLTKFCTELTSITQADVDGAPEYKEVIKQFQKWLYQYSNFLFCSWGDYDRNQFQRDSDFHKLSYPISADHLNIKKEFSRAQGLSKKQGMLEAMELARLKLEGRNHCGIDDARNMARLMPFVLGKEKISGKS